eukprot:NODE_25464_length_586_cov_3.202614.p2 GENE.NODE_25464_length_586_cov_3.202614~~NODE_25464_length_586_cov_3.202614.p2  ORF type:complete len:152 (-),score=46.24 NODE_25464_length_586_cov_3.202614:39-494(-)
MGRMYGKGKGIASSATPYKRKPQTWVKMTPEVAKDNIFKLAKKGLTPSQIGVVMRDSHGVPMIKTLTGTKIVRIMKAQGVAPKIPEDMYCLIKKAVSIHKHLERNKKDMDSRFRVILVESRIHRLARYYKRTKALPPAFKYAASTAATLIA